MSGAIIDKLKVGQTWMNGNEYKVKVLDFGLSDIWLLYPNGNRCAWPIGKFFDEYLLWEEA